MKKMLLAATFALVSSLFGSVQEANADWIGSGWYLGSLTQTRYFSWSGRSANFWVNRYPSSPTISGNTWSRGLQSSTIHWAITECIASGQPAQYTFWDLWSQGSNYSATPQCPNGYSLWRGGVFLWI